MKKSILTLAAIIIAVLLSSCSKPDLGTNDPTDNESLSNPKGSKITVNANPVIVYFRTDVIKNTQVPAMYVMNEDGTCKTKLFALQPGTGGQYTVPRWSPLGSSSICFGGYGDNYTVNGRSYRSNSVFRCDISVVNNVPKYSNLSRIWDGASTFNNMYDRAWNPNPTANEIAITSKDMRDNLFRILLIPADGIGTPTTFYTEDANHVITWLTYSGDGNYIAVSRLSSTTKSILIINRSDGSVYKEVDISQFYFAAMCLDWQRGSYTSIITFEGSLDGGIHRIYSVDINNNNGPELAVNNGFYNKQGSYSPDNSKMVLNCQTSPYGLKIYNFTTGTTTSVLNGIGSFPAWKR